MKNNDVYIERSLPKKGGLLAKVGDVVEPFTKLGMAKVSLGYLPLGEKFKPAKGKEEDGYFYTGDVLGRKGGKKITATFDGTLLKTADGKYVYQQEERDFWLFSGVWGEIVKIVKNTSVLVKTQTLDIHFAASNDISRSGELVVFPNPSEILEMQYLEKFSKDSFGKVIYVGDYIDLDIIKKAKTLGAFGLFSGSVDREAFTFAKKNNLFLGSISGFGHIPTPDFVFEVLKDLTNRYVFLHGDRGLLRIPMPKKFSDLETKSMSYSGQLREVGKGLLVQIFDGEHFGMVGRVDSVRDSEICVILDEAKDVVKIKVPNILALE